MKTKVLIYLNKRDLKPIGGPSGYLYNLNSGLEKIYSKNIFYIESDEKKMKKSIISRLYSLLPKWLFNYLKDYRIFKYYKRKVTESSHFTCVNLNDYDIVHFQNSMTMFDVRDSLKTYKGIIVLTSHSPKAYHKEIIEDVLPQREYLRHKNFYNSLEKIDEYAFNTANYIIFPCEEAEEPYFRTWSSYPIIKDQNKNKYMYLLSGVRRCEVRESRESVRNRYSIPNDAFVISFIGRHNEVKGYDILKEIGKEILESNKEIYFLVAGKEEPISRLICDNWIEVGWTNDPYSIIAASDLFVLPNRETYFDLVLLEVLSLGKIALLSETGGNKYFKKFNSKGLLFFDSIDSAISKINYLFSLNRNVLQDYENMNLEIFKNHFSDEIFAKNYLNLIEKIDIRCNKEERKYEIL